MGRDTQMALSDRQRTVPVLVLAPHLELCDIFTPKIQQSKSWFVMETK